MDYATLKKKINIEEALLFKDQKGYLFNLDKKIIYDINLLELVCGICVIGFLFLNIYAGIYALPLINQFSIELICLIFTLGFIVNFSCFFYLLTKITENKMLISFIKQDRNSFFKEKYSHLSKIFSNQQEMAPIVNELSQYKEQYQINLRFSYFYDSYSSFLYYIKQEDYEQVFWCFVNMVNYEKNIYLQNDNFQNLENEYIDIYNKLIFTQKLNEQLDPKNEFISSKKTKI